MMTSESAQKKHIFIITVSSPSLDDELMIYVYLYGAMILVKIEADRTEGSIDAVQAKHIALAPVRRRVHLALTEEASPQQRPHPRRPLAATIIFFPTTAAALKPPPGYQLLQ